MIFKNGTLEVIHPSRTPFKYGVSPLKWVFNIKGAYKSPFNFFPPAYIYEIQGSNMDASPC